jgi:hypothetical protein
MTVCCSGMPNHKSSRLQQVSRMAKLQFVHETILPSGNQTRDLQARIEQASGVSRVSSHPRPNAIHRKVYARARRSMAGCADCECPFQGVARRLSMPHSLTSPLLTRAIAAPRGRGSSTVGAGWTRSTPTIAPSSSRPASIATVYHLVCLFSCTQSDIAFFSPPLFCRASTACSASSRGSSSAPSRPSSAPSASSRRARGGGGLLRALAGTSH